MAQKATETLVALIQNEIKENGNAEITATKLADVLVEMAQNYSEQKMLCDTGMTAADIGKALMLDPTDGLVKVYQEEPAVSGQAVVYELEFTSVTTADPDNQPSLTLEDGSNGTSTTILHSEWNATTPGSTNEEAQNMANYIENNVSGWSGNWIERTNKCTITSDNLPQIFSNHSLSKNNLSNVTVVTIQEAAPDVPKYSKNMFVGFCGGVETINEALYVIIRSGKIQEAIAVANNPIDTEDLNVFAASELEGPSAFVLVGADGGKVRSIASSLDNFGVVGVAISELPNSVEELPVYVKELFFFIDNQYIF